MDAQIVVSFVRLMREHPQLEGNKKAYKKIIDKVADDTFTIQKQQLFNKIKKEKKDYMECYDIYMKFMAENGNQLFDKDTPTDEIVEKMFGAFNINIKDDTNVNQDKQD